MSQNGNLYQSRFLRTLERDGLVAVFHQLHPQLLYVRSNVWQSAIENLRGNSHESLLGELIERRLVVSNQSLDDDFLDATRRQILDSLNRSTILYLMLAQGCNFACVTCPIPALAEKYGRNLLSLDDALAGIKLWQDHIGDSVDKRPHYLIFYGGEPLLNREVLEQLLPQIKKMHDRSELPENLELMLSTNGVLLDESLVSVLKQYGVTVALGIDGPEEDNDRVRVDDQGEPTFTRIRKALDLLVDKGVMMVASVTITPNNLGRLDAYPDFLRTLGIQKFGYNLVKGRALDKMLGGMSREQYYKLAAKAVLFGLGEEEPYEYQLEKKLAVLRQGLPFSIDCTCQGSQLVIQADGQVSNCPFLRRDRGTVSGLDPSFRIWQTETVSRWRERLPILSKGGLQKEQGFLNGGGCTWSSYELTGEETAPDAGNEIFNQEVLNGLVWATFPKEAREDLATGRTEYWYHRRVGAL